ncbi:MAG TPA: hypothetical protein VM574_10475 [Terrimicrobiaceae bacterium]|nr:hypothetical protein [Terrimicrobiaceae bacterium]
MLLLCTELYLSKVRQKVPNDLGHGVCREANLIYNALYISKLNTRKFILVVFTDPERQFIPTPLRDANIFVLDSPWAYMRLLAFLTGQHRLRFPKQGAQAACHRRGGSRADVPSSQRHCQRPFR